MSRRWDYHKEWWTYYALPYVKKINPATSIGASKLKDEIDNQP